MNTMWIVNYADRPCERLIAEERDGSLYYINPKMLPEWGNLGMRINDATPLNDFGIIWDIKAGIFAGVLHPFILPSAKHKDGRPRKWQGSTSFTFKYTPIEPVGREE